MPRELAPKRLMSTNEVESSIVGPKHSHLTASDEGIKDDFLFYLFLPNFPIPSPQVVMYLVIEGNGSTRAGGERGFFFSWR